ncbi:hypothetical protein HDE_09580 [Halotydeus destructor]|nr:hypothetical protein HDE_09580 [Halotydeus destructor]
MVYKQQLVMFNLNLNTLRKVFLVSMLTLLAIQLFASECRAGDNDQTCELSKKKRMNDTWHHENYDADPRSLWNCGYCKGDEKKQGGGQGGEQAV